MTNLARKNASPVLLVGGTEYMHAFFAAEEEGNN